MSDLFGYGPSFSFPGGVSGPGVSKELRQRIALAMLMQKRKAPSTFGEGLSAIGESLGDIGTMRRLAAEENAAFTGGNKKADELLGTTPPVGAQGPSPVQAAAISAPSSLYQPPDQDPRSQAPVPPTVQEGGPTPTTQPMFRPNLRTATPPAQALPPAAPAVAAPPNVPGATRMSTPEQMADFRAQNPLPQNIPPLPPPGGPPPGLPPRPAVPARPSVADYGQRSALAPTPPPVVARGGDIPPEALAGLPTAPPDDPRRAATMALLKQRMGGQGAPAPPASAPPSLPPPNRDIAAAPPAAPIQKMPAPAPLSSPAEPQAGYISQPLKPVIAPTPEPMSKHEADLREAIARDPDGANGQLARRIGPVIKTLEDNRTAENARKIEQYKTDLAAERTRQENIEKQKGGAAENIAKVAQEQSQADIAKRFGGPVPYQQFVGDMSKSYDATQQLSNTLPTLKQAKQALAQSYTGSGAELKLDAGKMLRNLGVPGDYAPEVATEMLQSRMKAIAGGMIKSTVGSQNISDADRDFVEKAYSGTIKMEAESIRKLLSVAEDTTIRSINRHNDRLMSVANDPTKDTAIRNQYSVPMQYGDDAVAYLKAHPETAAMFDKKFGKGHAKAVLSGGRYGE